MHHLSRRSFLKSSAVLSAAAGLPGTLTSARAASTRPAREEKADIVVVGGSFGGVAAALAAARMGRSVILTDEYAWIGGQVTAQAIPLD
ncbi:MAG: FAD-dependent oxidoreductase, partial [Verrucomicrobiota bacterium]